ncbi:unnamed protein product, partial [Gongylonema pulchrum]|uniref:Ca2+-binding actin-bundling protein n=1 Tax=Gongylonema pulchrum TaxID=637853 RepID=A0A183DV50_9BILA
DENGHGSIPVADVQEALRVTGIDIPGFQFRDLMKRFGCGTHLTFSEFQDLFTELRAERDQEVKRWKEQIGSVTGAYTVKGLSEQSNEEIVHTIRVEEEVAFSNWINSSLINDSDLKDLVPVKTDGGDLYTKVQDGLIICQIDLIHVPGLFRLLQNDETLEDFRKLSPEQILIRWVNYHLSKAGVNRVLTNFTVDVSDSEIYTYLLNEIAPKGAGVTLHPLSVQGNVKRAAAMLDEADKLDCREFVAPNDVAQGNYKLNLAFVANLFNKYPGLPEPGADEIENIEVVEETREEKTYRNWMNSMGVNPYVNWLYSDLSNGIIILQCLFQLYDIIRAGLVNWKRVVTKFSKLKGMMDQIQNCNYAVELGRQLRFSLVGIQGKDIYDGNQTLTLALVWQLMSAYTLTVLAQCTHSGDRLATDKEIIAWVNQKLASSGRTTHIRSFQDPVISDACVVLDLIDAIKPGVIDYSLVKTGSVQANLENAKYAITSGRKIGAKIYALPEDIVESLNVFERVL